MTTVLCFGDSNTWGYVPGSDAQRFAPSQRWPGVAAKVLGGAHRIIEEALNGRTTVWDDPMKPNRRGRDHLVVALESHAPLDLTVIALGINDLKHHFGLSAVDVAQGAATLVDVAQLSGATQRVLLVCPVVPVVPDQPLGHRFDGAIERSQGLADAYREVAEQAGCLFFDANTVARASSVDGIHLDQANHRQLGEALGAFIADQF